MPDIFNDKEKAIDDATNRLDNKFQQMAEALFESIIQNLINNFDVTNGKIDTSKDNFTLLNSIDKIYNDFIKEHAPEFAKEIYQNVKKISQYNVDYYKQFSDNERQYKATTDNIQKIVEARLGITTDGSMVKLKPGGYMDSLLSDNTIKNEIKDLSIREVTSGEGFKDFKNKLENLIVGDKENMGGFRQYYRQYAYDIYVHADRLESNQIAKEIGLSDFIFSGTIIETSRYFCVHHAGKVFSVEESQQWKDLIGKYIEEPGKRPGTTRKIPIGPIVDSPENYDPVRDLGGIGCRHIARYISKEVAKALRGRK